MNFKNAFSNSVKNLIGILVGIALGLLIALRSIATLMILTVPIHTQRIFAFFVS